MDTLTKTISLKKVIPILILIFIGANLYLQLNPKPKNELYGTVDIREALLGFRVTGKIEKLFIEEGESVNPGQTLAQLDKTPYETQRLVTEAQVKQAIISLESSEREFKRQQELGVERVNSERDYDLALDQYKLSIANLELAQAQLSKTLLDIEDTILKASESGVVRNRIYEQGSVVGAGTPIYALSLETPVMVNSYASGLLLPSLKQGQAVTLRDASDHNYEGTISFIAERAEFTPQHIETQELRSTLVYRVRILVTNSEGRLKQGMPVTVLLQR